MMQSQVTPPTMVEVKRPRMKPVRKSKRTMANAVTSTKVSVAARNALFILRFVFARIRGDRH